MALTLTTDERTELERRVRSLKIRSEDARRARVILMPANGDSYSTIEATVPCFRDYINRWRRRFLADRIDGLQPRYKGQPPTVLTPAMEARVLEKTRQAPPDGSTHWSTRKLGRVLKIHHNLVAKAWQRAGLQPHRFERYMQSDDPDFEPKAADVIGLYVNPPDHAAVFRLDPVLPLSPGRAERHGFEYYRHRYVVALRGPEYPVGRSPRPDRGATHQRRLCRIPRQHRGQSAEAARDSCDRRQSLDP